MAAQPAAGAALRTAELVWMRAPLDLREPAAAAGVVVPIGRVALRELFVPLPAGGWGDDGEVGGGDETREVGGGDEARDGAATMAAAAAR